MANSTRYYQLTKNILLEYVYVDTESNIKDDSTNRIIDLKNKNKLSHKKLSWRDKKLQNFKATLLKKELSLMMMALLLITLML